MLGIIALTAGAALLYYASRSPSKPNLILGPQAGGSIKWAEFKGVFPNSEQDLLAPAQISTFTPDTLCAFAKGRAVVIIDTGIDNVTGHNNQVEAFYWGNVLANCGIKVTYD